MRKYLPLLIITLILISGCVENDTSKAGFGIVEETSNPDIYIKAESIPTEVRAERNITLYFTVENKQGFDIKNLTLDVYDQCLFTGPVKIFDSIELKANKSRTNTTKYQSSTPYSDTDCEIKFRTEYTGEAQLQKDIIVLTESEYSIREQQGTLENMTVRTFSSDNPVKVTISFSDNQPFLTGEKNYLYIDYSNTGTGFIDKLEPGKFSIHFPTNMKNITCNHYTFDSSSGNYVLDTNLRFYNDKAPRTSCSFIGDASQPTDIKTLNLIGNYKYVHDNSLIVKVKLR